MSRWKKYKVLTEDEYERLKMKELRDYNPQLKAQVRTEMDIDKVLANNSLTPDEKIRLIQTIRQTGTSKVDDAGFIPKVEAVAEPVPVPVEPATAPQVPEHSEVEDADVHALQPQVTAEDVMKSGDISEFVPLKFKTRARLLSKHMSQHPNVLSVNDNLELVARGKTLQGSNFIDLLNSLYAPRKYIRPIGEKEFVNTLKSINVPSTYVSNRSIAQSLASNKPIVYPLTTKKLKKLPKIPHTTHTPVLKLYNSSDA